MPPLPLVSLPRFMMHPPTPKPSYLCGHIQFAPAASHAITHLILLSSAATSHPQYEDATMYAAQEVVDVSHNGDPLSLGTMDAATHVSIAVNLDMIDDAACSLSGK